MQLNSLTNQTIALAGIAQAAALVDQLATTGTANAIALEASIGSILKIDSDSVVDVYGSLSGLKLGLEQMQTQMTGYKIPNHQQARYAASIVYLETKLSGHKDMLKIIQTGISRAQAQSEQYGVLHENVIANLGDIYFNTVRTLAPPVMVNGEQAYLSRTDTTNKIRALLLAGVRSSLLWKQCGGARWKFLFHRKKIVAELQDLLKRA
ncbi:high frequency lysogenization protein HflD [Crenothrix polyspora]|uniref:High frequency lysogenization protein HflD homolog n=1 Tax=Crenothrix polyspora TaxID=360316 RepID=A0A1R4HKH3_9GAMM|nr:high frequency lysogenization protein HflD [Crenothrix polyspora]SJM96541.1 High frequency lysogenization protein HflD homolog [Crenothrix polyspora]